MVGVDTEVRRIERLRRSESDVEDVSSERLRAAVDLACIVTAHPEVDHERIVQDAQLVLDFRASPGA